MIDSALKYYYLSMKIYDSIKTFAILNEVKMRVAAIYLENNMNEKAYKFINDSYNFFKNSFSNLLFVGENHRLRSLYFFNLNKLRDALIYADSAKILAEKISSLSLLKDIHYQKYKIYYKLGNLQKAVIELEEYNRIYQQLINQINAHYIYSLEKNLLLDAKNKEISKVYQDKEIVTHSLNITYTIIFIIFLLLIISFYLIYKIRSSRKQIQEQKKLLEEQNNLLKEHYKELKKQQETNQELIKLKDMIIKVIGHDLRNPISLIYSYSELLKTKYDDSYLKEKLNYISMSAYNSIDLLENLIEWAKMQSNETYSSIEKTDIRSLINDILEFFNSHITTKNLSVKLNCEIEHINTNKHYLRTIIRNILSNAIKFANEKSELYINILPNNNNLEVTIINYGKGITEEIIQKIYNNENIVSSSGTNQELGIGIGYELIKYFLEKLNGKIIIENIKIGTSVKVIIPLTKEVFH
ncbi:MAG TPA: HAMP domain-containing sensor histidine kinase [Ignavibacteriales bacterium]|nr:HAMP domain-containing sensor histidine kinase [Ignavibacteriales bacterium]HPD68217.1 HAMP domain-containing sensor histidine kinase [Ignavibacteriales bacterium]HRR19451.1 HAMP domain-containing sensor histidine kinase [Ignavibacteriales bacterium]